MLVGVTMAEDERSFHRVLPLDDVDSRAIDLAGRFSELVERLTVAARCALAIAATDRLVGRTRRGRRLADSQLRTGTAGSATSCSDCSTTSSPRPTAHPEPRRSQLSPGEIAAHLKARLEGRPTRANFRTGHLTVCTLEPMRSVPHRIVCLLGLDDDAFPRKAPRDGDDLLLDDPWIGERDPRSEDRQLLLDALMAAS